MAAVVGGMDGFKGCWGCMTVTGGQFGIFCVGCGDMWCMCVCRSNRICSLQQAAESGSQQQEPATRDKQRQVETHGFSTSVAPMLFDYEFGTFR